MGHWNVTLLGHLAPIETEPVGLSGPDWPLWALLLIALGIWVWAIRRVLHRQPPLAYEGRQPVPWSGGDVAVVFLSLTAIVFLAQGLLLYLYHVRPDAAGNLPDEVQPVLYAGQSVTELCVMLLSIVLLIRRRGADWADLGFDLGQVCRDLLIGLIGFLFIVAPVDMLYALLEPKKLHPLIELTMREPSLLWLIGFCAVLVAPVVEEFFFRVVLQGWLERRERSAWRGARMLSWMPAGVLPIVISSLLFAGATSVRVRRRYRCFSWPWSWAISTIKRTGCCRRWWSTPCSTAARS